MQGLPPDPYPPNMDNVAGPLDVLAAFLLYAIWSVLP